MSYQRVGKRGVASVFTTVECTVVVHRSYEFGCETFDYEHHNILAARSKCGVGHVNRRVEPVELLLVGKISGYYSQFVVGGTY